MSHPAKVLVGYSRIHLTYQHPRKKRVSPLSQPPNPPTPIFPITRNAHRYHSALKRRDIFPGKSQAQFPLFALLSRLHLYLVPLSRCRFPYRNCRTESRGSGRKPPNWHNNAPLSVRTTAPCPLLPSRRKPPARSIIQKRKATAEGRAAAMATTGREADQHR